MGDVRGHASNGRQSLGLDEAGFRGDCVRNIIGNDQNPANATLPGFVAERRHEHVDQALGETRDPLALERPRVSSFGDLCDRASERGKASKKRGVVDRRADIARAGSEDLVGSGIGRPDHAIPIDDQDRRAQRLHDLNLHSLKPLFGKRRLAQTLIARRQRLNHPLELRDELAELVVSPDVDSARQVAAGDRCDALVQQRDRSQQALRHERHRNADEQRQKAEQAQEERRALRLRGGQRAGARDPLLNALRRPVVVALDPLLGAPELREQVLDRLFVTSVTVEELLVLGVDLFVGLRNRVELSPNRAKRRRLPALLGQSLGPSRLPRKRAEA